MSECQREIRRLRHVVYLLQNENKALKDAVKYLSIEKHERKKRFKGFISSMINNVIEYRASEMKEGIRRLLLNIFD